MYLEMIEDKTKREVERLRDKDGSGKDRMRRLLTGEFGEEGVAELGIAIDGPDLAHFTYLGEIYHLLRVERTLGWEVGRSYSSRIDSVPGGTLAIAVVNAVASDRARTIVRGG